MSAVTVYLGLTINLRRGYRIGTRTNARRSERELPVHANASRRCLDQRPGLIRERHAALSALCAARALGVAGRQDRFARDGFPLLEPIEIARHIGVEDVRGIDPLRVEVEREHAVREFAIRLGCAIAGKRTAQKLAKKREAGAFV